MNEAAVKRSVRDYYDNVGWQRTSTGRYADQSADEREVVAPYWRRAWARVGRLLSGGEFLLDAGCGPVLRPEQRALYGGYEVPVSVDFSNTALTEARSKLGAAARLVQADVTMLPFRSECFDGVVSSHVLYHIPEHSQEAAIFELHRVLAKAGVCVILYTFPQSALARLSVPLGAALTQVRAVARRRRRAAHQQSKASRPHPQTEASAREPAPAPYFFAHDRHWLDRTLPSAWNVQVRSWASLNTEITWRLFRNTAASRRVLRAISWAEDLAPVVMGRLGSYPMIVVRKSGDPVLSARAR